MSSEIFSNMLKAEKRLLEDCQKGEPLQISEERPTEKTADNEIRGEFLRALILSNNQEIEVDKKNFILKIDPKGVMFSGIYVSGIFNFSFCSIDLPFLFVNSIFENNIMLVDSKIKIMYLFDSLINSINAQRLVCESDIFLSDGFEAQGEVNFASAQINGNLNCVNGKFNNKNGYALNCDTIKIGGSVFLKDSFESNGSVNFVSAQIGSNLECTKGKFNNQDGYALNCNGAKIGSVFLRDGFESQGKVDFISAQIGSDLDCNNGKFNNENGYALNCNSAKIGSVFLRNGFEAQGEVNFISAQIGSCLDCSNGKFINKNGYALTCDSAKIGGSVFLKDGFETQGEVNFHSCLISKSFIFSKSKEISFLILNSAQISRLDLDISNVENIDLDGLQYEHLADSKIFIELLEKMSKKDDFKPQPYKQLAKVLRNMGHHNDADDVMIEYNDIMTDKSENWFIKKLKQIYGKTAGYGYKPMRVFWSMFTVWFICSLFYWNASKVAVFAPSNPLVFQKKDFYACHVEEKGTSWSDIFNWEKYNSTNNWIDSKLDEEYTTFNPFWYSLDVILPIVDLQVEKDWGQYVPSNDWTLNDFTRWLMWFEILFGWIYSLILVAILSGLAKNEKD